MIRGHRKSKRRSVREEEEKEEEEEEEEEDDMEEEKGSSSSSSCSSCSARMCVRWALDGLPDGVQGHRTTCQESRRSCANAQGPNRYNGRSDTSVLPLAAEPQSVSNLFLVVLQGR